MAIIYKKNLTEKIMDILIYSILFILTLITLYPMLYTLSMSISSDIAVVQNKVFLLPKGFSLNGYELILRNSELWRSYANTILYTVTGTTLNVFLTIMAAYPLSRKNFFLRNKLMFFIVITMFFQGGLIPRFILIKNIGLYNNPLVMILPTAIITFNLIITRTFMSSIPGSLHEAAKIDGANDIRTLISIIIPLCAPIIAVLIIFYAVGHWNRYFDALLFLPNKDFQPLQIYLRKILVIGQDDALMDTELGFEQTALAIKIKYCVIIVSTLPILCVYPFMQKHFVKGVMIGAVKG